MSQTSEDPSTLTFGIVPADQRLAVYTDCLNDSRERQVVREILERDLLLTLNQMNQHCIKEYPLIPVQQQAIAEFLTRKAAEGNEIEAYAHSLTDNFINCLEKYVYAIETNDSREEENNRAALLNAEALLIKCLQGVCLVLAVCGDNFIEVMQHIFGESALAISDTIIHEHEVGETYWREHLEQIVSNGVKNAFKSIRESKVVDIRKEKQLLSLTYSFDSVLERLNNSERRLEKSQIQIDFEKSLTPPMQSRLTAMQSILENTSDLGITIPAELRRVIGQVMCLDSCAEEYPKKESGTKNTDKRSFLELQLISVACGAFLSLNTVTQDFLHAVGIVFPSAVNLARQELTEFSSAALKHFLLHLVEISFVQLLFGCFGESRSQMNLKAIRFHCLPGNSIEKLRGLGLNDELHDKLWQPDSEKSGGVVFIPTAAGELKQILEQATATPELIAQIVRFWHQAEIKTKFCVTVRLDKLMKATTNLNHRLSLILGRFGVLPSGS